MAYFSSKSKDGNPRIQDEFSDEFVARIEFLSTKGTQEYQAISRCFRTKLTDVYCNIYIFAKGLPRGNALVTSECNAQNVFINIGC